MLSLWTVPSAIQRILEDQTSDDMHSPVAKPVFGYLLQTRTKSIRSGAAMSSLMNHSNRAHHAFFGQSADAFLVY
jgi:hypothetical protein